jgi:hypothetical protein
MVEVQERQIAEYEAYVRTHGHPPLAPVKPYIAPQDDAVIVAVTPSGQQIGLGRDGKLYEQQMNKPFHKQKIVSLQLDFNDDSIDFLDEVHERQKMFAEAFSLSEPRRGDLDFAQRALETLPYIQVVPPTPTTATSFTAGVGPTAHVAHAPPPVFNLTPATPTRGPNWGKDPYAGRGGFISHRSYATAMDKIFPRNDSLPVPSANGSSSRSSCSDDQEANNYVGYTIFGEVPGQVSREPTPTPMTGGMRGRVGLRSASRRLFHPHSSLSSPGGMRAGLMEAQSRLSSPGRAGINPRQFVSSSGADGYLTPPLRSASAESSDF